MDRQEHLKYCKVSELRKFDFHKGITCGLTNEIADFEGNCIDFKGKFIPDSLLFYEPPDIRILRVQEMMLWVVDGVKKDHRPDLHPDDIISISILDPEPARRIFGDQARNGAVLVETKDH
jgi:hypothetical protein